MAGQLSLITKKSKKIESAEKLELLRDFHQTVVEQYRLQDFIYAMLYAPDPNWRLNQYTYMANRLLENLEIDPSDESNPVSKCIFLLFNIDNTLRESKVKSSKLSDNQKNTVPEPPQTEEEAIQRTNEEYVQHAWKDLALQLIMYVEGNCETNNKVGGSEYPKRIKWAQDAFLFMNLHLMPDLIMWLYNADKKKNSNDPFVVNREALLYFCRRVLRQQIQHLNNGVVTSIENFVAKCIAEYVMTVGLNRPDEENLDNYKPVINLHRLEKQ